MKTFIYDIDDNVSIIRTDTVHNGSRYAVMHKHKLTDTLTHVSPVGEYDNYEEALSKAEFYTDDD